MKPMVFAFVVGILFAGAFSQTKNKCGFHMRVTNCVPCSPICNQEPRVCPLYCIVNATFCQCEPGYCLPTINSDYCVSESRCSRKPRPIPSQAPYEKSSSDLFLVSD